MMVKYLFNLQKYTKYSLYQPSPLFMIGAFLFAILLAYQSDAYAQKKNINQTPSKVSSSEDEKKFDMLKSSNETVWTCENNVKVKTAQAGGQYLFLHNKKLYTMNGIEALNGVSRFSDIVHRIDWVIIPGKAMLFDSKAGQRLLDYCNHPDLAVVDKSKEIDLMK
jgi:hypothetical protein